MRTNLGGDGIGVGIEVFLTGVILAVGIENLDGRITK